MSAHPVREPGGPEPAHSKAHLPAPGRHLERPRAGTRTDAGPGYDLGPGRPHLAPGAGFGRVLTIPTPPLHMGMIQCPGADDPCLHPDRWRMHDTDPPWRPMGEP